MTRRLLPLALAAAIAFPAMAGRCRIATPPPHHCVSGEGEATVAPDLALLTLSVMREAKTARAALDANNDAMAAVIAAMKSAGIKDRDLQTAGIQINPRYNYTNKPDGSQEAELVAYQVTNTLSVRVRDIDKTARSWTRQCRSASTRAAALPSPTTTRRRPSPRPARRRWPTQWPRPRRLPSRRRQPRPGARDHGPEHRADADADQRQGLRCRGGRGSGTGRQNSSTSRSPSLSN